MFFLAVIFIIMFITHLRDFFFFLNRGINEFRLHIITSKALVSNKPIWATGDFLPLYEAKQQLQKHISVIVLFSSWLKSWGLCQPVIFAYNKWLLICIVRATPLTRSLFRSQMLSTDTSSLLRRISDHVKEQKIIIKGPLVQDSNDCSRSVHQ